MHLDEFALIQKINKKTGRGNSTVSVGIGDDAAVLTPPKKNLIATTDSLVENVHFSLKHFSPVDIGYKALAVNLSDLAAMGATPLYALVSLGIRKGLGEDFISSFYDGV